MKVVDIIGESLSKIFQHVKQFLRGQGLQGCIQYDPTIVLVSTIGAEPSEAFILFEYDIGV